ncbi:MAG: hypothetical protein PPP56_10805 [Longimonas sp.]|uniref:hypothetical protein n=1 Tax=Longimonas sp. TaxID=2039626 RepID=UPI00334812E0
MPVHAARPSVCGTLPGATPAAVMALVLALLLAGPVLADPAVAQSVDHIEDETLAEELATVDELRKQGEFMDAFGRLNNLLGDYPDHVEVLWRLSATEVNLGEQRGSTSLYEQGLETANRALEADSTNGLAHFVRSMAEGRLALEAGTREQIERSRAVKYHADRAIELDESLDGALNARGQWNREVASLGLMSRTIVRTVYGGLPDASYEQAVEDFKAALEIEDRILHRYELARTYAVMGQPEKAREQIEILLDMPNVYYDDPDLKEEARALLNDL